MPLKSQKFFKRWKRTLTDYLDGVSLCLEEAHQTGTADSLHNLRVAIRRTRVLVRLGRCVSGKPASQLFDQWGKAVNQAAGRLRDYDVVAEWLRSQDRGVRVAPSVVKRRDRLAKAVQRRVTPMPVEMHKQLVSVKPGNRKRNQLKKNYTEWREQLTRQISEKTGCLRQLDLAERHKLRRRLRKLRYLMELVLGPRKQKRNRFLRQLIRVQRALGEMQDRIVVQTVLGRLPRSFKLGGLKEIAQQEYASWLYKAEQELIELANIEPG